MKRLALIPSLAALAASASPARACDLSSTTIVFPGQGTHLSWYCKASEGEKREAVEAGRHSACISEKLHAWGRRPLSAECTDFIPYSLTKEEAMKSGPVLDCRIVLSTSTDNGYESKSGYQWSAVGQPHRPGFELSEPVLFFRDCPSSGCEERYQALCVAQPGTPY